MKRQRISLVLAAFTFACAAACGSPIGTAFNFRGALNRSGSPANGSYDFRFSLWDSVGGGAAVSATQALAAVAVSNGLFAVRLDFGTNAFAGEARYVEIAVRTNGVATYTLLSPRQPVPLAPYAFHAVSAGSLNLSSWSIGTGSVVDEGETHSNLLMFATTEGWQLLFTPDGGIHGTNYDIASWGASFGGELEVGGRTDLGSDLHVAGNLSVDQHLSAGQGADLTGAVNVEGPLNARGSLSTDDGLSVESNVFVNGESHFNGDLHVGGKLYAHGDAAVETADGSVYLRTSNTTLILEPGYISLDAYSTGGPPHDLVLDAAGTASFGGAIWVGGDAEVKGETVLHGDVTLYDALTCYGNCTFGDLYSYDIESQNNLTAQGGVLADYATFSGDVTARAYNTTSDRAAKENLAPVDGREVLARVVGLPVTRWNFIGEPGTQHIGPMAQDLYAAFRVGADDRHIATVDADGVALAAIQGLNQLVTEKDARIETLEKDVAALKAQVEALLRRPQGDVP